MQEAYDAFTSNLEASQKQNNILALEFNIDDATAQDDSAETEAAEVADLLSKI